MGLDLISAIRLRAMQVATWVYSRVRISSSPRPGLRILMYHAIGTPIEGDVRSLYNMTFTRFEQHMRYLADHHKNDLIPLGSPSLEGDSFKIALTFDDGYRDNLSAAAPLLVELGIPFTIFICTGAVAERKTGFLRPEDLRELAGLPGARIGSHTVNHPHLTECDDHRLREELIGSKLYLEDMLGMEVDLLSYPHGAVNGRVRCAAEKAGYRIGASSRFDINHSERDPLFLCRTDIWAKDDISMFEEKLRGDWDWVRRFSTDPSLKP